MKMTLGPGSVPVPVLEQSRKLTLVDEVVEYDAVYKCRWYEVEMQKILMMTIQCLAWVSLPVEQQEQAEV